MSIRGSSGRRNERERRSRGIRRRRLRCKRRDYVRDVESSSGRNIMA